MKYGQDAIDFPSQLEPAGLDQEVNKRPNSMIVFLFRSTKPFIWDVTYRVTSSSSNVMCSATRPDSAARQADESKLPRYRSLSNSFMVKPIAVETTGVLGAQAKSLVTAIGVEIAVRKCEPRESEWLFQRISLTTVQSNAFSISSACIMK